MRSGVRSPYAPPERKAGLQMRICFFRTKRKFHKNGSIKNVVVIILIYFRAFSSELYVTAPERTSASIMPAKQTTFIPAKLQTENFVGNASKRNHLTIPRRVKITQITNNAHIDATRIVLYMVISSCKNALDMELSTLSPPKTAITIAAKILVLYNYS